MATIAKRGNRWQVQIRRKGHPAHSKSFLMKSDALQWARYMEQQVDRGSLPEDASVLDDITLRLLLEKYRDEVIPFKRSPDREINLVNAFIKRCGDWVSLPLSAVTVSHFYKYRNERIQKVKPATVCRELGLVQHTYEVAIKEWGYPIPYNPVSKVKKPEIRNRRERRLGQGELKRLLCALREAANHEMYYLTLFAMATGMRRSEILAVKWQHINLTNRILHIPITKTGYSRTIPLSSRAIRVIERLRILNGTAGRLFNISEECVRSAWRRATAQAGISDLHFHDLRHEAISRFFERGLSVPEVATISGHRDFRMLYRYTHLKPEEIAKKLT